MNARLIKRVLLGLGALALLLVLVEAGFQIAEERRRMGTVVEAVDVTPYATPVGRLGIRGALVLLPPGDSFTAANVLLEGRHIAAVTPADSLVPGVDYLDATGHYLIPGLIDAHVHLLDSRNDLFVNLAHGVTGVFELYGKPHHLEWKAAAKTGALSPRLWVTSRKIGAREGFQADFEDWIGNHLNLTTRAEVAAAVAEHRAAGYDALKLSGYLTPEAFGWIDEAADAAGLPVVGHLDTDVGLEGLFASRMAALAHVEEVYKNTVTDFEAATGTHPYDDPAGHLAYHDSVVVDIARQMARRGVAAMTTVWLGEQIDDQKLGDLDAFHARLPMAYVNAGVAEGTSVYGGWLAPNNTYAEPGAYDDPERARREQAYWTAYEAALASTVRALDAAGVTLLAGTDANVAGAVPGDALHRELASLVAAGLTPAAALRAATVAPARFADWDTGEIREGYVADLVLLRGDPLRDIGATRSIERVFVNGYQLDSARMAAGLAAVAAANAAY